MSGTETAVERALRSFAAAALAEAAHELNNRLATMRETVGLLDDLARAGKAGAAGTARAHGALDDQVARALNVVRTLAGLGGALGAAGGSFDAAGAIGDLLALTERRMHRLSLRVERDIPAGLPAAAGDPALFLCLAHRLLARCVEAAGSGETLTARVQRAPGGVAVRLGARGAAGAAAAAGTATDREIDFELARRLGGTLTFEEGGGATIALAAAP